MKFRNLFTIVLAAAAVALAALSANAQRGGLWVMLDGTTNSVAANSTTYFYTNYVLDPHSAWYRSDGSPGLVGAPFISVQEYTNVGVTFTVHASSNCNGVATARLSRCMDNLRVFEASPSIVLQAPFNGTSNAIFAGDIWVPTETYLALWQIDNTNQGVYFTNEALSFNLKIPKVIAVQGVE